ncbi:hypothetical protein DCO58_04050 [Helicobacter saguini]|uniref:Uncharacterized protein n=1 Tax=Helicobacter saguini TaxID=1548018 RepID=A0A347VSK3_9HELI|nr:hypothetical protein [Helicobacter saguini]MWV62471.1 hypothetical protein [Helicobacter saguini]MWV66856.1 hypothetical protein [Helicobacter saguini]MWV69205.1 hypothetical protein [Helicobacter saguini]MWV71240.1 hypothetical protein [Helicobacter saguini]TLD93293.1 hypothetical protein LS64_008590 [Helicobacter saguini]
MRIFVFLLSFISFFCICLNGCVKKDFIESRIDLGSLGQFKSSSISNDSKITNYKDFIESKNKKPMIEIAKICYSFFGNESYKGYEILNIENLLKKAKETTGISEFKNVGIYLKEINILSIWQKRCLILGKDSN